MGLIEGLKIAADTLRAADKISEYQQILTAMEKISELQQELQEKIVELAKVRAELDAIQIDQLSVSEMTEYYQLYKLRGRYFCPHCWIVEKRLGPIVFTGNSSSQLQCTRCKQSFSWVHNPISPGSA